MGKGKWKREQNKHRRSKRSERERRKNGDNNGRSRAGTVKEAEESVGIKDRYARRSQFSQHSLHFLHRQHSSESSQPQIHNREALTFHQHRLSSRIWYCPAGFSTGFYVFVLFNSVDDCLFCLLMSSFAFSARQALDRVEEEVNALADCCDR